MQFVSGLLVLLVSLFDVCECYYSKEDYGLSENTFQLIRSIEDEVPEDGYAIGDQLFFQLTIEPVVAILDTVSIQLTSFVNDYSSLVFCGDPYIYSITPVSNWEVFSLDDIEPYVSINYFFIKNSAYY